MTVFLMLLQWIPERQFLEHDGLICQVQALYEFGAKNGQKILTGRIDIDNTGPETLRIGQVTLTADAETFPAMTKDELREHWKGSWWLFGADDLGKDTWVLTNIVDQIVPSGAKATFTVSFVMPKKNKMPSDLVLAVEGIGEVGLKR